MLLPELSHKLRSGDHAAAMAAENRSIEMALLLTLPAAVALFVAADPIVRVLFEHGAFTPLDATATASMLAALALALPAFVLIKVFHPGFFAREDTKTPMLYAGIGMTANVALSLTLFVVLGSIGIAIATAIAGWLQAVLLAYTLRQRGDFALDAISRRRFPAILAATLIMGVVVFLLTRLLAGGFAPENDLLVQAASLAGLVGGGLLAYGVAAEALGAVELRSLVKRLRGA